MKRYERSSIVARALGPHMQEEPGKSKEEQEEPRESEDESAEPGDARRSHEDQGEQ